MGTLPEYFTPAVVVKLASPKEISLVIISYRNKTFRVLDANNKLIAVTTIAQKNYIYIMNFINKMHFNFSNYFLINGKFSSLNPINYSPNKLSIFRFNKHNIDETSRKAINF